MPAKPSALLDTRVIYCGDNLDQLGKLPEACVDLIYIDFLLLPLPVGARIGEMDFMDEWYPIQVKQTDKVGRPDIDAFETAMQRAERKLGYFVGFEFTGDALFEIDRFRRKEGREIKPLTVREILDEEIATT